MGVTATFFGGGMLCWMQMQPQHVIDCYFAEEVRTDGNRVAMTPHQGRQGHPQGNDKAAAGPLDEAVSDSYRGQWLCC